MIFSRLYETRDDGFSYRKSCQLAHWASTTRAVCHLHPLLNLSWSPTSGSCVEAKSVPARGSSSLLHLAWAPRYLIISALSLFLVAALKVNLLI